MFIGLSIVRFVSETVDTIIKSSVRQPFSSVLQNLHLCNYNLYRQQHSSNKQLHLQLRRGNIQSTTTAIVIITKYGAQTWGNTWLWAVGSIVGSSLLPSSSTRISRRFYPQRSSGQAVVTGAAPSPPRHVPSFLSRIGFSIPTDRRFSSNCMDPRNINERLLPTVHREYKCFQIHIQIYRDSVTQ